MKGTLYLVPVTLGTENYKHVIPADVIKLIISLRYFIVEDIRSARRFLRLIDNNFPIDDSEFSVLNEHTDNTITGSYLSSLENGHDVGLLSEAGIPCVADPGSYLVRLAHEKSIKVVPLTGPSSIILALMASGLDGQNFCFRGYIPIKSDERKRAIKELERDSQKGASQIIIEAPYRNQKLLDDILSVCSPDLRLCIAVDISMESEFIRTQSIRNWTKDVPAINKRQAIFIIGS